MLPYHHALAGSLLKLLILLPGNKIQIQVTFNEWSYVPDTYVLHRVYYYEIVLKYFWWNACKNML